MDTRTDICRSISLMQDTDNIQKNIIAAECRKVRAQIQSVREKGADQKKNRHTGHQKPAKAVIIRFVLEDKVKDKACNKREPEQVGNDKPFHKRNVGIQR